jgi:hypothetical protein
MDGWEFFGACTARWSILLLCTDMRLLSPAIGARSVGCDMYSAVLSRIALRDSYNNW